MGSDMAAATSASAPVLAVDLDGTLLRSDLLFESFWSAWARNWRAPLVALAGLRQGRAGMKAALAGLAEVDVATLPYAEPVIDHVRAWRAAGGRTELVTASDDRLARQVAAHLGLFDAVQGSADGTNLKGAAKAEWLVARHGEGGFHYAGDSAADLAVWQRAGGVVAVNPAPALDRKIMALAPDATRITVPRGRAGWWKALRPHQWLKNLLVFLPVLAGHRLDAAALLPALLAFCAFSMVASGVYLLNDMLDLAADRRHPRKRNRPFAAGTLSLAAGSIAFPLLLLGGLGLAALGGPLLLISLLVYLFLTTSYSLWLKRLIVIDICVLACVYTLRLVAGGAATGITVSVWLFSFSIFLFLSLAAVKRQAELVAGVKSGTVKAVGRGYHVDDLAVVANMAISAGYVSVLVLALYLNSPAVVALYHAPQLLWGVVPVMLFWISRMTMTAHRGDMHDDPLVFAATDGVSLVCAGLIVALAVAATLA